MSSRTIRHWLPSASLALAVVLAGLQPPAIAKLAIFPSVLVTRTGHRIGPVGHIGALTVAPVLASDSLDVGPFSSLDVALKAGTAIVQEVGTGRPASASTNPIAHHHGEFDPPANAAHLPQQQTRNTEQNQQRQVQTNDGSAQVNTPASSKRR
jgi:hypothetical protein